MTKLEMMKLSQGLSDLYTGLETDLIANIAEYLKHGDINSSTAQWKMQLLAQLGTLDKANIKTIAEYAGIAPEMLTEVLETAALTAIEELEPGFQSLARDGIINNTAVPIENTMARALKTYNKQARNDLNMVNTVMRYKAKNAAQKVINDTAELAEKQSFLNMLNKATGKAVTGAESRQAAMRQCVKEMSEKGIPAFVDKLGREWSPEAYVNMDIRTTVANTAHQAQFDRMDDYDLNLIEVSSHAGARPKCAKDQGKIFNRSGKGGYTEDLNDNKIRYYAWNSSSYGEPDGLLGINCGHQIYPFVPGISRQTYFPYDEEENDKLYQKMQGQRELERRVRKSKRECMALEKLGDTEGLEKASATLKQRQQALRQYCADNELSYKADRTAVVNYKSSVAGFTPSDKKKRIAEIQAKTVDKSSESGIIKSEKRSEWDNNLQPRAQVVEKIAEDDLYAFVTKELNIDQENATDMVDSVLAFTDDYYIDVRAYQRGEFPNAIDDIKEMSENIETYIKKAPRWNGGETFRGVTVSDDELAKYVPGYKFDMGGTASWTNLSDKSADFANRNISYERPNSVIYHSDTQSKGTGIRHISVFDHESEVLCSKDAKYEIVRTEKDYDGIIHVYLKEVEI